MPSFGRPQELINAELRSAELVVVMFWNRMGFPSNKESEKTGTQEEFELARDLYKQSADQVYGHEGSPRILLYFRRQTTPETEQAKKVLSFRKSLEEERDLFFREYESYEEWEEMFREHVVPFLDGIIPVDVNGAVANLPKRDSILSGNFLLRRVYDSQILMIDFDFDGDRNTETIKFWFQQTGHWLNIYKFDQGKSCSFDAEFQQFLDEASIIELAVKDVNNDGFPELLIAAYSSSSFTSQLSIWGYDTGSSTSRMINQFTQIARLVGQRQIYIVEGGLINMPYGSVGLFTQYKWTGTSFVSDHLSDGSFVSKD